jgi:hypothetical protein
LATGSLCFLITNVFISSSFLKDNFIGDRIVGWCFYL